MKKINIMFIALSAILMSLINVGCDTDDDDTFHSEPEQPSSGLTAPKLDKYLTTTDNDGVSFRVRFTNGGDAGANMSCKVHWRKYTSRPSKTPSEKDMTEHESMRVYDGLKTKTTFDKSHAGIKGGTYLYYYFECSNSRHTTTSDVTFCIVKR